MMSLRRIGMKRMLFGMGAAGVLVAAGSLLHARPSEPSDHHEVRCDRGKIRGVYQLETTGTNVAAHRLSAAVGLFTADGDGNLSGSVTTSDDGVIIRGDFVGTYTLNADCTGTIDIPGGSFTQGDFVIDPKGEKLRLIVTNTGAVITGIAERMEQ
jgi:hypothetical protein